MRSRGTILMVLASVLPPGLSLGACGEPTGVFWEDAGERQELVVALVLGGPVTAADTLPVVAIGNATAGRPSHCRWEATRTEHQADLTLWVGSDRWVGPPPLPPYDLEFRCAFLVGPPISAGVFRVVLHQADGSTLTDSVMVEAPGPPVGVPVTLGRGE